MRRSSFAFLGLLVLAACAPTAAQLALRDVDQHRAAAHATPGDAEAADYAQSVHSATLAHAYAKDAPRLAVDVDDALAVLDSAIARGSADAPTLVAWRALLLTDAGRYDQAMAEFERSMELGPNLLAAKNLVVIWGSAPDPEKVGEVCATTVPALATGEEQFELMDLCKEQMHALTEDAALAWATPEEVEFYRAEQQRRADAADAAAAQAAEREAYEQRVVREDEICGDRCNQRMYRCEGPCDQQDADCMNPCIEENNSCVSACTSAAHERLGD